MRKSHMMHKIAVNSIEKVGRELGVSKQAASIQYKKIKSKIAKRLLKERENPFSNEDVNNLVKSSLFDELLFRACWEEWALNKH